MGLLDTNVTATLVDIKLTKKGKELIAKGFKDDNIFDVVKFSFGDSEIDYRIDNPSGVSITEASVDSVDFKSKLYASGTIPSGTPTISLTNTSISMTTEQKDISVAATTNWPPVVGVYDEKYTWMNLGPLNDYDFIMTQSLDTKAITLQTLDVTGSTTVKVQGLTSGVYTTFTLNVT